MSAVVAHAGVGRDSFYESFDDFEHALRVAAARSTAALTQALRAAALPSGPAAVNEAAGTSALVSNVCSAWLRFASEDPLQMQCALALPDAARAFADTLMEGRGAGVPEDLVEVAAKELALMACATEIATAVSNAELERSGVMPNSRAVSIKSRKGASARPQMGPCAMSLAEGTQVLTSAVLKILR